ncbi:MAG: Ig-like domain-containing protein, partial [Patescibacteria group bacterium]
LHVCAVSSSGSAYCWGANGSGQLGDNTTVDKSVPVQVKGVGGTGTLANIVSIGTGYYHTCAVSSSGSAYCWGNNTNGRLGDNTTVAKSVPVQVLGVGAVGTLNLNPSTYYTPGTFTSAVIDLGAKASFTTLSWTETLNGQTVTMKARSSANSDMSGATAWASCTNITSGANLSTGGCVTNGHQYIQYQATLSTINPAVTPTLDSVTIGYTQYASSGDLTSSKYDIGSDAVISKLTWVASTSTTETVRFQMQSSPDNVTWSGWCGYDETGATCNGSNYFTDAHNGVTLGTSNPLRSTSGGGLADRYFQYKVFLASGGAATPTLTSVTVQYVVNAPPAVGNVLPAQITDSGNANYGKVSFSFEASDADTSTGSPSNQFKVTPTLYEYYNGSSWATISSGLGANAYSVITLTADSATTTTTVVWTPTAGIPLTSGAKIRVTISDGEAANFSATATSGTFALDTTAPTVASTGGFLVDSSVGGAGVAGIKLVATDDSTMQYRLCNDNAFPSNDGQGNSCAWSTLASSVALATSTTSWNTALNASSTEVVYMQVRDLYGNVTAKTATAPRTPANFIATDTTNLNASTYREFLSWGTADSAGFGSYKVYYNTTGAGASYNLLSTISDDAQNYYTHTITTATSSTHYYKGVTVSTNGDVSEFTLVKSDVPDGSGSTDVTAPYIPSAGIAASSVRNTSANITFSTYTDVSLAEGELATSTVRYASYTGTAPTSCPSANSVSTGTYVVNHSIYLTGLTPSTNYVFCVLAKDIAGNVSMPSLVSEAGGTFTTIGGPAITGVTQREVSDISATIFWNTNTSSDSKVYYATTAAGVNAGTLVSGAAVTTSGTNANGTFYQHQIGLTGLVSGVTYYYKVVSADAGDSQLISTDDNLGQYYSFVTLKDTTPPTITGTSTPVLAPTAAVIVWQTDEMADAQVFYDTASHGTDTSLYPKYTTAQVPSTSVKSIYHVMTLSSDTTNSGSAGGTNALVKETPYYFVVKSADAAGNTALSSGTLTTPADGNVTITTVHVTRVTEGTLPDTTAPSISNVKVSDITPFSAVVKFDTDEDAVAFMKYGKDTAYGDTAGDDVWAKTHTIKLRGLTLGTEYHLKVSANDKAGNTGTGSDQTFKTTFLSENLKDMAKIENIEQFQKEIEDTIESILPSLVPPFVSKPTVTDITENGATVSFRTNIKSFPVVGFVEDALYDATKETPYTGEVSDTTEKAVDHTVALLNLKQNTKYRVQARAFSLPKVIGKSADITFTTKASKITGSIIERKKDSFTVVWTTDEPTSSIVEYKNVKSGITERKTDDAKRTSHSMRVENLPSGTTYAVDISGLNEGGNVVEAGASLTVTTSRDVTPPVISGFKVDNALVPGRTDRIQTIVSWKTDEPANSTTYYEEGAGTAGDTRELANKNEVLDSYVMAHSVILPNLKPGTIYRLKVTSSDDSGNEGSFGPRTVITPRQTESITDIIFKNFEDSFKFLRDI